MNMLNYKQEECGRIFFLMCFSSFKEPNPLSKIIRDISFQRVTMWFRIQLSEYLPSISFLVSKTGHIYAKLTDIGLILQRTNPYAYRTQFKHLAFQGKDILPLTGFDIPSKTLSAQVVPLALTYKLIVNANVQLGLLLVINLNNGYARKEGMRKFVTSDKKSPLLVCVEERDDKCVSVPKWIEDFVKDLQLYREEVMKHYLPSDPRLKRKCNSVQKSKRQRLTPEEPKSTEEPQSPKEPLPESPDLPKSAEKPLPESPQSPDLPESSEEPPVEIPLEPLGINLDEPPIKCESPKPAEESRTSEAPRTPDKPRTPEELEAPPEPMEPENLEETPEELEATPEPENLEETPETMEPEIKEEQPIEPPEEKQEAPPISMAVINVSHMNFAPSMKFFPEPGDLIVKFKQPPGRIFFIQGDKDGMYWMSDKR